MTRQADLTEASSTRPWPAEGIERWAIERDPRRQQRRLRSEADLDRIAAASTVNQVDQKTYWVLAKS